MSLYEHVAGLPVVVEGIRLELLRAEVSSGFQRVTTRVELFGGGQVGEGEDVTYDADTHEASLPRQSALPVAGTHTVDSLSQLFEQHLLPVEQSYERWGFESAALDLALRQAGLTFPAAFGREFAPLRFVVSTRLGSPPDDEIVRGWMAATPGLEFKLDPQSSWTPELFASLASTGRVRVLDLKSVYKDSPVDQPFDPVLYRRVRDMALAAGGSILHRGPRRGPRRPRRARRRRRPLQLGCAHPLGGRHRGARVAPGRHQHQALALRLAAPPAGGHRVLQPSRASPCTGAGSSSWARAATRSRRWRRPSTRTRRTTSRRASTTRATRGRVCRGARSCPRARRGPVSASCGSEAARDPILGRLGRPGEASVVGGIAEHRCAEPRRHGRARRRGGVLRKSRHHRDADRRGAGPRTGDACRARTVRGRVHRRRRRVGAHDGAARRDAAAPGPRSCQRPREPAQRAARAHARRQLDRRSRHPTPRLRLAAHLGHRGAHRQRGLDAQPSVGGRDGRGEPCRGRGGTRAAGPRGVAHHPRRLPVGTGAGAALRAPVARAARGPRVRRSRRRRVCCARAAVESCSAARR